MDARHIYPGVKVIHVSLVTFMSQWFPLSAGVDVLQRVWAVSGFMLVSFILGPWKPYVRTHSMLTSCFMLLFFLNYGHLVEIRTKMWFGELTSVYLQRQTASFVHIRAVPRHTVIQCLTHNHQCVRLAGLTTLKSPVPIVNYAVSRAIYVSIFWGTAGQLDCWSHQNCI